ncbi:MAG: glutamate--tRNA ligase [Candidatus Nanoarchaeia archaeon]
MVEKEKIRLYALENAVKYQGEASLKAVMPALFSEGLEKNKVKEIMPIVNKIIEEVNNLSIEEQKAELDILRNKGLETSKREYREGLPDLPNLKGKPVLRFAPFPSGPLHIGNTRQLVLNDAYAKQHDGSFLLVIDDTIGSDEKPIATEAYDLIKEGVDWLKCKYEKIIYKSDRIEKYYAYAEELIKKGYMYVCSCSKESIRENRKLGRACACRELPPYKHVERWQKMFKAKEGEYVVRLKTSMQHKNPAFRDRIMFRISDRKHPRKKHNVWPLLEFSWAIDDHLLGITHIIRGIDLQMETEVEKYIWDIFGWEHPETIHTGHFSIKGLHLSKSKGQKEVLAGKYIGWHDPRTWSLQSLKARGIQPEAIREFVLNMGLTKSDSSIAIDVLYAINRKYLEDKPRYLFVPEPVKVHISGCPEMKANIPLYPNKKETREINTKQDFYIPRQDYDLMENRDYRLLHLLSFESKQVLKIKPRTFSFISEEPSKDEKYLQWLPADANKKDNIYVMVRMPDNNVINGLGEPALKSLKKGDVVQFERFGFCCLYKLDKKNNTAEFWFSHR